MIYYLCFCELHEMMMNAKIYSVEMISLSIHIDWRVFSVIHFLNLDMSKGLWGKESLSLFGRPLFS